MKRLAVLVSVLSLSTSIFASHHLHEGKASQHHKSIASYSTTLQKAIEKQGDIYGHGTAIHGLDLLSMLTGEEASKGKKVGFHQDRGASREEFFNIVRAVKTAIVDDFNGSFLVDQILRSKDKFSEMKGANAEVFERHLDHVYLIASFFQEKTSATTTDIETIINRVINNAYRPKLSDTDTIRLEQDDQPIKMTIDEDRAYALLNAVKRILPSLPRVIGKIGIKAQDTGIEAVKIIDQYKNEMQVPRYLQKYQQKGFLGAFHDVLAFKFSENDEIFYEESLKDVQDFQRQLLYIKPGSSDNRTRRSSDQLESMLFTTGRFASQMPYRFLLEDSEGIKHLVGYVPPAFHNVDIPHLLRVKNIVFLSNEKMTDSAKFRAEKLSNHIDEMGGLLYPWRDFKDASFNGYQGLPGKSYQDSATGNEIAKTDFKVAATIEQRIFGVNRPPLILEDAMPPAYNDALLSFFSKSRGLFPVQKLSEYLGAMDNMFAPEKDMLKIAIKILRGGKKSENTKSSEEKVNEAQGLNLLNYWQHLHEDHFERKAHFNKKSAERIQQFVNELFSIPYLTFQDGRIVDESKSSKVSYITSVNHLGRYLENIGVSRMHHNKNFFKEHYFMISADENIFKETIYRRDNAAAAKRAFRILYDNFYTSQALFHLDINTWTLKKVSDGYYGPDMKIQVEELLGVLNGQYRRVPGFKEIKLVIRDNESPNGDVIQD